VSALSPHLVTKSSSWFGALDGTPEHAELAARSVPACSFRAVKRARATKRASSPLVPTNCAVCWPRLDSESSTFTPTTMADCTFGATSALVKAVKPVASH
jgi:hypothetical protein